MRKVKGNKKNLVEEHFVPWAFVFHFSIALVSAGVGLILFLVFGMLCFAFSMRIILITRWCFGCCSAVLTQNHGLGWPVLCQRADAEGAGRDHGQELAKGRFRNRTSCPVHELGSAGWELPVPAGERLGIVQWAAILCITCFFQVLILSPSSLMLQLLLLSYFILFQLLSFSYLYPWGLLFLSGFPPHLRQGGGQGVTVWYRVAGWD